MTGRSTTIQEYRIINATLRDDGRGRIERARHLPPEAFTEVSCATLWRRMLALPRNKSPEHALIGCGVHMGDLDTIRGAGFSVATFDDEVELVREAWAGKVYSALAEDFKHGRISIAEMREKFDAITAKPADSVLSDVIGRRIAASSPPPEPIPRFYLAGKPIATPGNLVSLIAKAKSGKTAAIGGILASAVASAVGRDGVDTLGFTASNPEGGALILIDTEQSMFDAYECYMRALHRAGQDEDPPWLCAYGLAGYAPDRLHAALQLVIEHAASAHPRIFAVVLDGVADFVADVNDIKESNALVADLHRLAIEYNCPIICVIHSNEGEKAGPDGRGHLGKQLARKSESNLLLVKDGDITTITSEKQRKAPITKADGIAFRWSDEEGRHVSCSPGFSMKEEARRAELADLAAEVFGTDSRLTWSELKRRIAAARGMKGKEPDKRITKMKEMGVIKGPSIGGYERVA